MINSKNLCSYRFSFLQKLNENRELSGSLFFTTIMIASASPGFQNNAKNYYHARTRKTYKTPKDAKNYFNTHEDAKIFLLWPRECLNANNHIDSNLFVIFCYLFNLCYCLFIMVKKRYNVYIR